MPKNKSELFPGGEIKRGPDLDLGTMPVRVSRAFYDKDKGSSYLLLGTGGEGTAGDGTEFHVTFAANGDTLISVGSYDAPDHMERRYMVRGVDVIAAVLKFDEARRKATEGK